MPKEVNGFQKIRKGYWTGKKRSKETIEKIRLKQTGKKYKPRSKESKERMRKIMINKHQHWAWRGGRYETSEGYIMIFKPNYPTATKNGYILEHRFIMEQHIGRHLLPTEVIHHINKNISDNRIENLKLFPNWSEHTKFHKHFNAVLYSSSGPLQ